MSLSMVMARHFYMIHSFLNSGLGRRKERPRLVKSGLAGYQTMFKK